MKTDRSAEADVAPPVEQAVGRLADACDGVADGELQTWPEDDGDQYPDWLTTSPEAAAAENLSYWTDDE